MHPNIISPMGRMLLGLCSYVVLGLIAVLIVAAFYFSIVGAHARDLGQWAQLRNAQAPENPGWGNWYARQRQPDVDFSCCGPADAYWADKFEIVDGKFFAIVTDEREDGPSGRPHIDPGTRIEIPPHKFNDPRKDPNETGHGIVFVSLDRRIFCYFNPPGEG